MGIRAQTRFPREKLRIVISVRCNQMSPSDDLVEVISEKKFELDGVRDWKKEAVITIFGSKFTIWGGAEKDTG